MLGNFVRHVRLSFALPTGRISLYLYVSERLDGNDGGVSDWDHELSWVNLLTVVNGVEGMLDNSVVVRRHKHRPLWEFSNKRSPLAP